MPTGVLFNWVCHLHWSAIFHEYLQVVLKVRAVRVGFAEMSAGGHPER